MWRFTLGNHQPTNHVYSYQIIGTVLATCLYWTVPAATRAEDATSRPQRLLVHLNAGPTEQKAIDATLTLANSLRKSGHEVTLFLDLEGVSLGDSQLTRVPLQHRAGITQQLAEFHKAGGKSIICPSCAERLGLKPGSVLREIRPTSKAELEALTKQADREYEYREEDSQAAPSSSSQSAKL